MATDWLVDIYRTDWATILQPQIIIQLFITFFFLKGFRVNVDPSEEIVGCKPPTRSSFFAAEFNEAAKLKASRCWLQPSNR